MRNMRHFTHASSAMASTLVSLGAAWILAAPAAAQSSAAAPAVNASPAEDAEIVVTGTSIRGVAPVGSNLVSVTREQIENTSVQTIQQLLRTVPSITAAGNAGQGPAGTSYYSPTIHSLGSSASNSTLVLIDGHRFSLGGQPHPLSDPNIIPPIALERVEVLAEGASSTYGSDAVAGVINFITRSNYKGLEATGQSGFGDSYRTYNAALLWGTTWETGSVMVAYAFSQRSALAFAARDHLRPDHRPQGGTNFQSFNCSPATIQPGGSGPIFLTPTGTTSVANNAANAPCDNSVFGDVLPQEVRNNVMAKIKQDVGDRLTLGVDLVYSNRQNTQDTARGGFNATAFRTGAQANPFYVNPPGTVPGTTAGDRQTVRWQADELLGPGAYSANGSINYYVSGSLEYRIDDNFRVTALGLVGRDDHKTDSNGQLCVSCANLGLNGTTNAGGSLTQPSIPGTNLIITGLPLTADNALDVWNPAASNRTSAAVRSALIDNRTLAAFNHSITQAKIGLDGSLFKLPGGDVRIAIGGEYLRYGLDVERSRPNNTGPSSRGSEQLALNLGRNVKSAFAEVLIPIFGPENAMPGLRRLEINLSARHDSYNDVGSTTNPKVAASWEPAKGFRVRGNWSKSFVAPAISSIGDASRAGLASFSGYGTDGGSIIIPIANYPLAAQLPGCTAPGQVTCNIGGTVQGITYNNGNPGLRPQTGRGWSAGFDLVPEFLPGFKLGVTLFNANFRGGVTSPNLATVINTAGLNSLLTIYPNGATAAQIATIVGQAPLNNPLPAVVYYIRNGQQQNVVNLDIQGLDIDISYRIKTQSAGEFLIGGSVSRFTRFNQNIGGGPSFSILNTTGFNETFPSIQTQGRFNLGWDFGAFSAIGFVNYIPSYSNWSSSTVAPLTRDANGNPNGGGDRVKAQALIDLNLSYTFRKAGAFSGSQIFLDAVNLLNKAPPFYNNANGYDTYGGNPIGRVVTVGLRVKL